MTRRIGVYPGTFDPITNGHIDVIRRATRLVDHLVVGVAVNAGKDPLFTLDERAAMVTEELRHIANDGGVSNGGQAVSLETRPFEGLLMDFVKAVDGTVVLRGLRAVSDFEYEFQMTWMNARLDPSIETAFLMASENHQFIAARLVKEICRLGGDVSSFVSPRVAEKLQDRLHRGAPSTAGGR